MKTVKRGFRTWAVCMAIAATAGASAGSHAAEAPWGVYQGAGCDGTRQIGSFISWYGTKPARAVDFLPSNNWNDMKATATWVAQCWRAAGYDSLTLSVPMLVSAGGSLAEGASGQYDDTFRQIGATLVAHGYGNAILRLGFEFNGDWFPWAAARDPGSFILYWRRIVGVMRSVPGSSFRFDWNPSAAGGAGAGRANPETVYPGDDVVDIIGLDFYNQSWNPQVVTPQQRWNESLTMTYGLQWHRNFAAAHGKPLSFPEWGTGTRPDGAGGGDDAYFIDQMAAWVRANNVAYHNYWDYPALDYNARLSDNHQPLAGASFIRNFTVVSRKPNPPTNLAAN